MNRAEPREITESFRLERVLKSSRSAIVFQAVGPDSGSTVAIKLIPPWSPANLDSCRDQFLVAMGVLESARPETFPALLDYGFCPDGSAFMVMDLVRGERFDSLADAQPERVLGLMLGVLDGVEVLARNGISHGNLAPENLLTTGEGPTRRITILGFGTAAFHGGITGVSGVALTEGPLQFAAPEQLDPATALTADWRSDLYALAASTCALLRAEVFPADAPAPSVALPASLRARLQDPAALQIILEQSLRREPSERPTSLDEFRQAVVAALPSALARRRPAGGVEARALGNETPTVPPLEQPPPGASAERPAPSETREASGPRTSTPVLLGRPAERLALEAPPPPAVPAPATSKAPTVEKLKTGPVPIARLAELPATPIAPRKAEPQPAAETRPLAEPTPATEPAPPDFIQPAVPSVGADAAPGTPAEGHTAGDTPLRAAETAPPTGKPGPLRKRAFLLWVVGIVAVVVGASVAGWLWIGNRQGEKPTPRAVPAAAPRRPSPALQAPSVNAATALLGRAETAIALDDLPTAAAALDAITPADLGGLPQVEQERYATLRATYGTRRRQALTRAMQRSLSAGNLKALGDTERGITREEETSFKRDADFSASLEEARRALTLQATLARAQRQGDLSQVLQSASVLIEVVPRYAQAVEAREKAAASLEREADALAAKGNVDLALARLDTVHRSWPTRAGLQGRLERIKAQKEADLKFAAVIAEVQQTEADKVPEKGLELLKALQAEPRTAERVQQARDRLAKQLEQLDAQPPTLALAPGLKLEYKKGEPVNLAFKIRDDHAVKGAQLYARVEGSGRYVELPLRHPAGSDWSAEISMSFHQNQTVEFYVVATDHSGHTAQLGTVQEPLKLKRKKNIFGF